jgi:formamidopyrimidine-DNA glycosylase
MPELPEVQTIVDDLIKAGVAGHTLQAVEVHWPKSIATPTAQRFQSGLPGDRFASLSRRGKFIVFALESGGFLLVHLRMSGHLHLVPPRQPRGKHEHVIMRLKGAFDLRFHDPRKFGRLYWVTDPAEVLGHLGPEPLSTAFTGKRLAGMLAQRRRQLKPLLLDQGFVAGLGNIYTDEALWASRLHPETLSSSVGADRACRLHRAIRRVLRRGLGNGGTTLSRGAATFTSVNGHAGRNRDALSVFRRTGQPCLRCGTPIARIIVGQRSSHICPQCQKEE